MRAPEGLGKSVGSAVAAAALVMFAGCDGWKDEQVVTQCFESARGCMLTCDNAERGAHGADNACRDACTGAFKGAVTVCADMTDREQRNQCIDKANQASGECLKSCDDTFEKRRKEAVDCRGQCVDQLQQCAAPPKDPRK